MIFRDGIDAARVKAAGQILVGLNKTRRAYNQRVRELEEREGLMPEPGDKLVCLRNDSKKGLLNGSLWTVQDLIARSPQETAPDRRAGRRSDA